MNRFDLIKESRSEYYTRTFDNIDPVSIGAAVTTAITVGKQIFGKKPDDPAERLRFANVYFEIYADRLNGMDWKSIRSKWQERLPRREAKKRQELSEVFFYPATGTTEQRKFAFLLENMNNELNKAGLSQISLDQAKQIYDMGKNLITIFDESASVPLSTTGQPITRQNQLPEIDYGMQSPDQPSKPGILSAEIFSQPGTLIMIVVIGLILVFAIFRK